jgi:hypothetical protein
VDTIPTCEPSASTRRTLGTRMRSLYRGSLLGGAMTGHCCSSGCASYRDGIRRRFVSNGPKGAQGGETRCIAPLALDPHSLTNCRSNRTSVGMSWRGGQATEAANHLAVALTAEAAQRLQ